MTIPSNSPLTEFIVFPLNCVVRGVEDATQQDRAYDYVFLCTKAFPSLVNSANVVAPLVSERTGIVAAQNGIGIEDGLLRLFPNNPVSPGEIVNSGFIRFIIGANPPAQDMPVGEARTAASERFRRDQLVAQALVMDLRLSKVPIDLTDNIQGYRWLKAAWNVAFNPVAVEFESPEVVIERTSKRVAYKPSMVQDYFDGLPMELETIVKTPLDLAHRFSVPALHSESVYEILRLKASPTEKGLERNQTMPANS
ncbi:hypothetical protein IWQ60_007995 [Tieghemiomyces parasiticus]|uniref:2-dehydropantoate 2-reductase n=1 Tax=Tieghemiomyces parasiticus TaxID=78921 RepID=A0A9W8DSF7_9FUNG|nr:hypothetical protein IWQ60_007995 [Tieghemiomyces parasiticus]